MRTPLTVGELRAELALYPDDATIDVYVREVDGTDRVLQIVAAGYGPGVVPDEVLGSSLPLRAAVPAGLDPRAR